MSSPMPVSAWSGSTASPACSPTVTTVAGGFRRSVRISIYRPRVLAHDGARRRPTATSAFGVSRRENHDATAFYARFTAPELSDDSTVTSHAVRNAIWHGDARRMDEHGSINDASVALVVTSPPYFAGKEYEAALGHGHIPASYREYLAMLHAVFSE